MDWQIFLKIKTVRNVLSLQQVYDGRQVHKFAMLGSNPNWNSAIVSIFCSFYI